MASDFFESIDLSSMAEDLSNKNNQGEKTQPLVSDSGSKEKSFDGWGSNESDESWMRTSPIKSGKNLQTDGDLTEILLPPSVKIDPAVGWLVCVDGVDKGRSFRLVKGNNTVGRAGNGKNYSVVLTDQAISRKGACGVIVYNEKSNQFFITPGDLTTNINPYLNEEILLSPKLLTAHSTLEIAGDILIFIPFCSDKFKWKFEEEEEEKPKQEEPKPERSAKEQILRCERGHYYNASIHEKCPYCESENSDNDPDGTTKIMFK